jgi:hypothetical protein
MQRGWQVNSSEESTSSRIEKLHELAALGAAELEARYGDGLKAWLTEFVSTELPGTPAPPLGSWEEVAEAVDHLARNKRAWSQRLGSIVIELSDSQTPEAEEQASAKLREFIQQCPWKYLCDSASRKLG